MSKYGFYSSIKRFLKSKYLLNLFTLLCMGVLPACMSMYHMRAWGRGQKRVWDPLELTGIIDGCDLPHGCWESNLGPSEKQLRVKRTLSTAEPSL